MPRPALLATLVVAALLPLPAGHAYEVRSFTGPVEGITLAPGSVAPIAMEWGYVETETFEPCLTPEQRESIQKEIERSRAALRASGKLAAPNRGAAVTFEWPLKGIASMGFHDEGYHGISNFVDQNPLAGLQDYNCGQRTYEGHQGTDYFLWPFAWYKKNHRHVQAVAPADGVIIYKQGFRPDTSCTQSGAPWNAVYLEYPDGSITWSGHLKAVGLTSKFVGDTVYVGEKLGWVASSGSSTGPHLHLEVYDPDGFLVDPYAGPCNSLNANTWWVQQHPYYDSGINAVMTHSDPPVFPPCPQEEIINEQIEFPGVSPIVRTAAYYRDQLDTQQSTYTVRRPDGTVYSSWTHNSNAPHYAASHWRWVHNLGTSPQTGIWKFEVEYLGETYTQLFGVGTTALDAPLANAAAGPILLDHRPNPVRRDTDILFRLPEAGRARLVIFDVGGRQVRTVLDATQPAGSGAVTWDGRNEDGSRVPAGVYFYRLESGPSVQTRKMTVVR